MKPFSRNMESLNIYTISMYYTWSNSGFTHTNPRRPTFLFCGLLVTLIIVCFAEVSSRYIQTGGPYLSAHDVFGPVVGFEVGWIMWIAPAHGFRSQL